MVKLFTQRAKVLFQKKQTTIFSAAVVIMATVAMSRILGLVRDRMLAGRFTTDELGVYFAAFRIPNLIFELLVMGALSTAFIPVISALVAKDKNKEAFYVASSVINIGSIILGIAGLLLFIFTKQVASFIAPGFSPEELEVLIPFTRIMLIGQVGPLLIGNFLTGILQSFRLFIVPAIAPVVYNIGIIGAILFLTPTLGLYAPVWGVVIGAFLFLIIQIPLVYSVGYRHRIVADYKNKDVRIVGKLMLPRTFGVAISQVDATVDLILATLLGARNVTIFNFAQHLQLVPVGLFGIPIATAALPSLSITTIRENKNEFKTLFINGIHQILFFVLPASVILVVLRIPLVRLVFGADHFDWEATVLTGKTVAAFSLSLFAQSIVQLMSRAFFALQDSKTPVIVGIIAIATNILLSVIFVTRIGLPVWGLGMSASIASIVNAFLLFILIYRKIGGFDLRSVFIPVIKMCIATAITGVSLYVPMKLLDQLIFDTTRTINLIMLTIVVTVIGLFVYILISFLLHLEEVALFKVFASKVIKVRQILLDTSSEVVDNVDTQHMK